MGLELLTNIGEPASKFTPHGFRYVPASIALQKHIPEVVKLVDTSIGDPTLVLKDLYKGIMPRRGGIVEIGKRSLLGSFDLQAVEATSYGWTFLPQLKANVDPDTKLLKAAGAITLTIFDIRSDHFGECRGVQPIAEVFNPDEDPWRAQHYSESQRLVQNEYGLVVGMISVLDSAHLQTLPVSTDQALGSTTIRLSSTDKV